MSSQRLKCSADSPFCNLELAREELKVQEEALKKSLARQTIVDGHDVKSHQTAAGSDRQTVQKPPKRFIPDEGPETKNFEAAASYKAVGLTSQPAQGSPKQEEASNTRCNRQSEPRYRPLTGTKE